MENEIAVRFYENERYGTTFGKALYRRALYNATADVSNPKAKYLLDLHKYNEWEHTAKTDDDMALLENAEAYIGTASKDDWVGTWVKRLDADGSKPRVMGFGLLDMHKLELILVINDEEYGVQNAWQLAVKPCKQARPNKKSPQLLATNTDLS